MKTLDAKLADYLEVDGWDLAQTHAQDLAWWADEIWQIKSRWPPEGTEVFITFLVDPMWEGDRKKGQGVWAVGRSASFPHSRRDAERGGILRLNASKEDIEGFVQLVDGFRRSLGNV